MIPALRTGDYLAAARRRAMGGVSSRPFAARRMFGVAA